MKCDSLKKISLFLFSCIFCFLFNAPVSGAEQADTDLSKTIFSEATVMNIQGAFHSDEVLPVVQAIAKVRDMASLYDVKFALSERFKAFVSLGQPNIEDPTGRYPVRNHNYNAMFGFSIALQ
ncbi:MAG: hypothetical protein EHM54_11135 [Nitrospiraceae bacterium]|nr:MAG: hypothetical protein EHM54_11135 [Nitrospiraceae bacterium]